MVGYGDFKTLIINLGSSSLKFAIYSSNGKRIEKGNIEKFKNYEDAMKKLTNSVSLEEIDRVVYRIVHGFGLESPKRINSNLIKEMEKHKDLAPLHMPFALEVIKILKKKINGKHIACFDTSFHNSVSKKANRYSIPRKISDRYGIKRYGFHGLAHKSLYRKACEISGKKCKKVITCQLGSGASVCAIRNGESQDTSMGFTPLEGLFGSTRSGSIDPALVLYLENKLGKSSDKVRDLLENKSGFLGLTGESDVREILKMAKKGNKKAKLALEMFAYQVRKAIGSYAFALEDIEAIVLGGGISRSWEIRKKILSGLEGFGIKLDSKKIRIKEGKISKAGSKVDVFVFETDEGREMFEMVGWI